MPESRLPEIDMSCWGFDWPRTSRGRQTPIFAKYNGGFERTQAIFDNWNMDLTVLQMKMCPSNRNSLFGHLVMDYPHVSISIRVWWWAVLSNCIFFIKLNLVQVCSLWRKCRHTSALCMNPPSLALLGITLWWFSTVHICCDKSWNGFAWCFCLCIKIYIILLLCEIFPRGPLTFSFTLRLTPFWLFQHANSFLMLPLIFNNWVILKHLNMNTSLSFYSFLITAFVPKAWFLISKQYNYCKKGKNHWENTLATDWIETHLQILTIL